LGAGKPPRAEEVLAAARERATEQHKNILVIFSASWCEPCRELEAFLDSSQINPIIAKHFVIARLTTAEEFGGNPKLNTPGAERLILKLGGVLGSLPFFAFLKPNGELIINSRRPVKNKADSGNIGFPTEPDEIDWFMIMLKKGAPTLTVDDEHVIGTSLRNN
jgi:thiol-disulfide isomerase/thioredoxin